MEKQKKKKIFFFSYSIIEKKLIYPINFFDKIHEFIFGPSYEDATRKEFVWINEDGHIYIDGLSGCGGHYIAVTMRRINASLNKEDIYEFTPCLGKGDPDLLAAIKNIKDEKKRSKLLLYAS